MTDTTGVDAQATHAHPPRQGTDFGPVRDSYDRIAARYAETFADELARRPLDRAMLAAFAEQVPRGLPVADVGCGPGHITAHLAALGVPVLGIDLSPGMVAEAAARHADLEFRTGTMLALDAPDEAWSGVMCFYALIHLSAPERAAAIAEFARVLCPGGLLLAAFHIDGPMAEAGDTVHAESLLDQPVALDFHFIDPDEVAAACAAAGLTIEARLDRTPYPSDVPTRRCYLLAAKPPADH
jgi:ubiquinone/menaquinone biosynthesis C-methylase UbiE